MWVKHVILTNMAKRKLIFIFLLVMHSCLLASCTGNHASKETTKVSDEFRSFLATHKTESSDLVSDSFDSYQFTLENGRLSIIGTDNTEVWRSNEEWYVDSFKIGDVNCDQILDIAFVVWKSYSFGAKHPARMTNEDAAILCHLFVYSIKDNRVKPLWCSSNLPRPIYSFELNEDGEQTPTQSGVRLVTLEGTYTEDHSETTPTEYMYEWSSWGFSPMITPSAPPNKR